jgi:hypothetical protein
MRRIAKLVPIFSSVLLVIGVAAGSASAATTWHTGQVSTGGTAFGMACATPARCYAITWTRITTRDGNTVTSAPAPLPPGAAPSDELFMHAIACPGSDSCVAVGSLQPLGGRGVSGLVEQISAMGVVASEVTPSAGYDTLGFTAVACPAVGGCYALGTEQALNAAGAVTTRTPIYARQAGDSWVIHPLPVDAGSISCATPNWCVALSATTIVTLSNGQASRQSFPTPANYRRSVEVDALACPSVGNCTFVGLDQRHVHYLPLIKRAVVGVLHAGAWRVRLTDLPGDAARGDALKVQPTGLSCPGVTHCVAVGFYATNRRFVNAGVLISRAGDSLSVRAAPLPAGTSSRPPTGRLNAVSCPTVTSCDAVGVIGNRAVDDVWNGSTWRSSTVPGVPGEPSPSALEFDTLDCPAVADCFATGGYAWRPDANGEFSAFTEAYAVKS